ncbi:hypothetical protein BZG01_03730 [Labilibaculum manganireducens]|uniref:YdhG-like domain-containing protein n=1 Tax=Labilibaculum manganireducens TaxID=1940525 RepID=A0A2N3IF16_9BACT|nr:DUF1801 domain-containing protein [Labilibaculum manganireducens]PKQ68833.1 hypothetical protein BZG01_03730 [Labilibaculum manganireducens]
MEKSVNKGVQEFIDKTGASDPIKHQILLELRKIVFENFPDVKERMMYGGIMFSLDDDFGGVFVYKNHVSFEFGNGFLFQDPEKLLEGNGKYRRHVKIKCLDEVKTKKLDFFVKQSQIDEQ